MSGWVETRPLGDTNQAWRVAGISSDGQVAVAGVDLKRIYLSTDRAVNWAEVRPAGDVDRAWADVALSSDGAVIIAVVNGGRVFLSKNSGSTFTEVRPAGDANKNWTCCACDADGSVLACGVHGGRLYRSVDGGDTWSETRPDGDANRDWYRVRVSSDGARMICAGSHYGVFLSSNTGSTWTNISPLAYQYYLTCDIAADGNAILLCAYATPYGDALSWYRTADGQPWREGSVSDQWSWCALSGDGSTAICTSRGRAQRTLDAAVNWDNIASTFSMGGPTALDFNAVDLSNDASYGLLGVRGKRLWRYDSTQTISPDSIASATTFGGLTVTPGAVTIVPDSLVNVTLFGRPALNDTGLTVKIVSPFGTKDIPEVIVTVTPTIDWVFTRVQKTFFVSLYDDTDGEPVYDSGWITSATKSHTVTLSLTVGHTYSAQIACTDSEDVEFRADERSWFHVNDPALAAPVLTDEANTTTGVIVTLEWAAVVPADGDELTYEVEVIYPDGTTKTFEAGDTTAFKLGYLGHDGA